MNRESFEYKDYSMNLVDPTELHELVEALSVQDILTLAVNDEGVRADHSHYKELYDIQTEYIERYVEKLPNFDNTYLKKNIKFLLKHHNLKMNELERVLGISKGYLSRTMKKEALRKLSIDVAWKIANVFGVELDKMIDTDFSEKDGNVEIIRGFLRTLQDESDAAVMVWKDLGGETKEADDVIKKIPLFKVKKDEVYYLLPDGKEAAVKGDIFMTEDSDELRSLILIPYRMGRKTLFAFAFYWENSQKGMQVERIFSSGDDRSGALDTQAKILYECVKAHLGDIPLSSDMKEFMKKFTMKER